MCTAPRLPYCASPALTRSAQLRVDTTTPRVSPWMDGCSCGGAFALLHILHSYILRQCSCVHAGWWLCMVFMHTSCACVCICLSCLIVPLLTHCHSNGNSGRLGLGPEVTKAVRTPTHVSSLTSRGLFVWSVACGAAHTAITTRIEVQHSTDAASEGATNVVGGLVLVTGAGWALGREQLSSFAVVKEFKNVSVHDMHTHTRIPCSMVACMRPVSCCAIHITFSHQPCFGGFL